jgi:hypothetical protein
MPPLDLLQGTLDMLILQTLQWGPQHGYAIGQTIRARSSETLKVETGSLYPALHRLEKQGWVKSEWDVTERESARQVLSDSRLRARSSSSRSATDGRSSSPRSARCSVPTTRRGDVLSVIDWLTRRRREHDLQNEIDAHLSMAIADRVRDGEDPREARLAALKEFGNVTLTREHARSAWAGGWRIWLADLGHDVRYSLRLLRRSPGYTTVILIVLALGIGANISVFRFFRPLALAPVPGVEGSARLGVLVARDCGRGASCRSRTSTSVM